MTEEYVDPRYLTTPMWLLIQKFGYEWVNKQHELFKQIYEESKCNIIV